MNKHRVQIKDNFTSKIKWTKWFKGEYNSFMWEEGNYSCDCNRGLFFYNYRKDFPCSEGRFKVINIEVEGE